MNEQLLLNESEKRPLSHMKEGSVKIDNSSEKDTNRNPLRIIPEGIWILIIPAITYMIGYCYECGSARYYMIPYNLVSVDIVSSALVMSQGLLYLLICIALVLGYTWTFLDHEKIVCKVISKYVFAFFPSTFILLFRHTSKSVWYIIICFLCILLLFDFIYPIIAIKGQKTYKEKFVESYERNLNNKNISVSILKYLGANNYLIMWFLLLSLWAANSIGYHDAYMRKEYLTAQINGNDYVVVAIYKDKIVCCGIDKANSQLKSSLLILNQEKMNEKVFIRERVGPLKKTMDSL